MVKSSPENQYGLAKNFAYPYPAWLMDGTLNIQNKPGTGVKTGNAFMNSRPEEYLFIRTSQSIARPVLNRHGMKKPKPEEREIINGVARLDKVKALNFKDSYALFRIFNNLPRGQQTLDMYNNEHFWGTLGQSRLTLAAFWGYFFSDIKPFDKPVPVKIEPGPVNIVHIPRTPVLERALEDVGIGWNEIATPKNRRRR